MTRVLIAGVAGAGCDIAVCVYAAVGGRVVAINTDRTALRIVSLPESILIGPLVLARKSLSEANARLTPPGSS